MAPSVRSALARLNDTRSVTHGVVWTLLNAGLTLIEPRRLSTGGRLAYRAAMGALAAWTAWATMRTDMRDELTTGARAGYTAGTAGLLLAASDATEALDGRIHDAVVRAGARRPRAVMALEGAALAGVTWWWGRRTPAPAPVGATGEEDEPRQDVVDVPDDVRAIAERLLGASDGFGAAELRAQLAQAKAVLYEGPEPDGFWPGIGFEVPDELPFAVPGDANFPVVGVYRPLEGRAFEVYLTVLGGRLSTLSISEGRDWSDDEQVTWMEAGRGVHELPGWPDASELELLIETPHGLRPATG
ncbi:hypothetical protein [Microbacterium sp. NPDC096154]|uniref:hypothetical protein n=1 Tax=Microbacterium sp. NPDC096154 TaxID=3155549 RepID=UPI0033221A5A